MLRELRNNLLIVPLFILIACGSSSSALSYESTTVSIQSSGQTLTVTAEIADTVVKQNQGLMNRTSLDENAGMLFVFDSEAERSFWMKDTFIPLDILFISAAKEIVSIEENTTPLSEEAILSSSPAQYVLEVNAGYVASHNVNIGDPLSF